MRLLGGMLGTWTAPLTIKAATVTAALALGSYESMIASRASKESRRCRHGRACAAATGSTGVTWCGAFPVNDLSRCRVSSMRQDGRNRRPDGGHVSEKRKDQAY